MPPEQDQPSTIAAYAIAIATALEQVEISPREVFDKAGVPLPTTPDPMVRLTDRDISALFAEGVRRTGNPAFGIAVGEALHPANLHALGYAMMSSTSLRDFCERVKNYFRMATASAEIRTEETSDEFLLITIAHGEDLCWETHDAYATLLLRFIRFIYSNDFNFTRLELIRPDPGESREQYDAYFRCPISYGNRELSMGFDAAVIDQSLPGASKELAQMHDQTVAQYLQKLEKSDIVNRVRTIVVEELASHVLTKQHVADRLFVSARSLQMKLAAKGTSFQEILDTTRESLAMSYMEQSGTSITEAAYLLGFSDVSNFTRAFKRWTGKSPREYRQSLGLDQ
jgi:AraC-like DNA-binding protein